MQKFRPEDDEVGLPVIKISEMRLGFTEKSGRATSDLDSKYIVEDGDILFSWSGSLLIKQWSEGIGALNQHLFKVTSDEYPKWFFYFATKRHLPWFQSIAESKATTMGHINRKHLSQALIASPKIEVLEELGKVFEPILEKSFRSLVESRSLASTKDTLLPKLLSGEIDVAGVKSA